MPLLPLDCKTLRCDVSLSTARLEESNSTSVNLLRPRMGGWTDRRALYACQPGLGSGRLNQVHAGAVDLFHAVRLSHLYIQDISPPLFCLFPSAIHLRSACMHLGSLCSWLKCSEVPLCSHPAPAHAEQFALCRWQRLQIRSDHEHPPVKLLFQHLKAVDITICQTSRIRHGMRSTTPERRRCMKF
jgi:hypothetical protein